MCSMSMLSPPICAGAANRRGTAAKPAPRPKVFLRKSRLFFIALPLQKFAGPTVREGQWILDRREVHGQAVDIKSLLWLYLCLEGKGETQMRRMLKDAPRAVGGAGGPLSALHAAAGSGATNLAAASRTTAPAWPTVN